MGSQPGRQYFPDRFIHRTGNPLIQLPGIHRAWFPPTSQAFPSYICGLRSGIYPSRVGIPELRGDSHLYRDPPRNISISRIGRQPWLPECPTQVKTQLYIHAGLSRTPRTPKAGSLLLRSGISEMAQLSLGYTNLRRSCAPRDSHDIHNNFL